MASAALARPDVLVLAGGGIVGEAWMHGVLAGLEDAAGRDFRRSRRFVGTSAGLDRRGAPGGGPPAAAAGRRPRAAPRPATPSATARGGRAPARRRASRAARPRVGWARARRWPARRVAVGAPAGALARAAVLAARRADGASLTGCARASRAGTRASTGGCGSARSTGGRAGASSSARRARRTATVADAVCASCAIPWVFAPVRIGDREYVDGGAWSVTNLDAARAGRGTQMLCLDPTAGLGGGDRRMAALRGASASPPALEIQALRRRGARSSTSRPTPRAATAMGTNFMAPRHGRAALAAGYRQGRALGGALTLCVSASDATNRRATLRTP